MADLRSQRENRRYLPGLTLRPDLRVTAGLPEALDGAEVLIVAVPTASVRTRGRAAARGRDGRSDRGVGLQGAGAGFAPHPRRRAGAGPAADPGRVAVGAHLRDRDCPRAAGGGGGRPLTISRRQRWSSGCSRRRLSGSTPPRTCRGWRLAARSRTSSPSRPAARTAWASATTRARRSSPAGCNEMGRLAMRLGGNPLTLAGLAGLGDLVLTCTGELSRNRRVGLALAGGEPLDRDPRQPGARGRGRVHGPHRRRAGPRAGRAHADHRPGRRRARGPAHAPRSGGRPAGARPGPGARLAGPERSEGTQLFRTS